MGNGKYNICLLLCCFGENEVRKCSKTTWLDIITSNWHKYIFKILFFFNFAPLFLTIVMVIIVSHRDTLQILYKVLKKSISTVIGNNINWLWDFTIGISFCQNIKRADPFITQQWKEEVFAQIDIREVSNELHEYYNGA